MCVVCVGGGVTYRYRVQQLLDLSRMFSPGFNALVFPSNRSKLQHSVNRRSCPSTPVAGHEFRTKEQYTDDNHTMTHEYACYKMCCETEKKQQVVSQLKNKKTCGLAYGVYTDSSKNTRGPKQVPCYPGSPPQESTDAACEFGVLANTPNSNAAAVACVATN